MVTGTGANQGNWHVRGWSDITAQDSGSVTIRTRAAIETFGGWSYSGLNIHAGACVDGQWAGVDKTGVNVGTNSAVQLVEKTLKIAKGRAARNVTTIADVRVNGFAAGFSQIKLTVNIPAKPSHTVSYNANGGSGAPANQTKWYGEVLTLSVSKPTRPNHTFQGWATSAGGAVAYQPGGRYGADSNVTLYAVWKLATKPPTIGSFTAQRVNAMLEPSESSTRVQVSASWKCDTAGDTSNAVQSVKFAVQTEAGAWNETAVTASGASGTVTAVFDDLDADRTWRFRVTVKDKYGSTTSYATVGQQRFLLDFSADGRGIGIGVGAPVEGVAIAGEPVSINGCRVPRMVMGSKVVTPTGESNKHDLFTATEWANLMGSTDGMASAVLVVSNGDVEAYASNTIEWVSVTGAAYVKSSAKWVVFVDQRITHPFRVNFMILC